MRLSLTLTAIIGIMTAVSADATVIFSATNSPQLNEENVLFNTAGLTGGPALTVTGATATTGFLVNFSSNENLVTPTGGQALVAAQDGDFTVMSVSLTGAYFTDMIFNLNNVAGTSGTASITAHLLSGDSFSFSLNVANGSNFGTLIADSGDKLVGVDISSTIQLQDIRQTRISGATSLTDTQVVPEPTTLALVGGALIGLGAIARRRKR